MMEGLGVVYTQTQTHTHTPRRVVREGRPDAPVCVCVRVCVCVCVCVPPPPCLCVYPHVDDDGWWMMMRRARPRPSTDVGTARHGTARDGTGRRGGGGRRASTALRQPGGIPSSVLVESFRQAFRARVKRARGWRRARGREVSSSWSASSSASSWSASSRSGRW